MSQTFSDYIVYADESGDHGLEKIDPDYPIFCLVFALIKKTEYIENVVPAFQSFKMKYFGHDMIVLHEHEIRKQKNEFGVLRTSLELREEFLSELTALIDRATFYLIASVIRKELYRKRKRVPSSPYDISLLFCMERILQKLTELGEVGKTVHVVFECRGKREDAELELTFRRIISGEENWGYRSSDFSKIEFIPVFRDKKANSTGVQLADLTARPIGLSILRPNQKNRAMNSLEGKVITKCFP